MCGIAKIQPVTEALRIGESPFWYSPNKLLYFVDVSESNIHSFNPETGESFKAHLGPNPIIFIIPIDRTRDKFIIGHGGDLEIITWDGKSSEVSSRFSYAQLEKLEKIRLNDGNCSPSGILFVGSTGETFDNSGTVPSGLGALYVLDTKRDPPCIKTLLQDIGISNGLTWNKSEEILYWCETTQRKIYKFDYDKIHFKLTNQKLVLDFKKAHLPGRPNGMTIDYMGYLWIACLDDAHQVIKIDPKHGRVLQKVDFGTISKITSLAWGGKDCLELYVTTAATEGEENSGCLFKVTCTGSKGFPSAPVRISMCDEHVKAAQEAEKKKK